jgi:hypothetical protein
MPLKAIVKEINWVSKWTYNCLNKECPICRNHIESPSIHGGDKFIMSECGHGYHEDCLSKWFQQLGNVEKKCPVCFNHWKEMKLSKNDESIFNHNLGTHTMNIINQGLIHSFNTDFSNNQTNFIQDLDIDNLDDLSDSDSDIETDE